MDNEPYYIVKASQLFKLLKHCFCCGNKAEVDNTRTIGTLLIVTLICDSCTKNPKWFSQPYVGKSKIPEGNLLLSSGILFSGASPSKVMQVLDIARIESISEQTYFKYQRDCLNPIIWHHYKNEQQAIIEKAKKNETGLILGGDA